MIQMFFSEYRKKVLYSAVLISALLLSGCGKDTRMDTSPEPQAGKKDTSLIGTGQDQSFGTDLFGGGMVYNSTLLTDEKLFCSYELPVISPRKLNNIRIVQANVSGEGTYEIITDDVSSGNVYKGWYYYYLHFRVSVSQQTPADFSIDSFDLDIDGEPYVYTPAKMVFYNTEGFFGEKISDEGKALLYLDAPEALQNTIHDDPSDPVTFVMEVNEDCTLRDFCALDFLDVSDISYFVNEEEVFTEKGGLSLKKGDELEISFCLNYQEGLSDSDLIKTSRIISYETLDGTSWLVNDPQGFLIIGFEEDRMIHNYIDKVLLSEQEDGYEE